MEFSQINENIDTISKSSVLIDNINNNKKNKGILFKVPKNENENDISLNKENVDRKDNYCAEGQFDKVFKFKVLNKKEESECNNESLNQTCFTQSSNLKTSLYHNLMNNNILTNSREEFKDDSFISLFKNNHLYNNSIQEIHDKFQIDDSNFRNFNFLNKQSLISFFSLKNSGRKLCQKNNQICDVSKSEVFTPLNINSYDIVKKSRKKFQFFHRKKNKDKSSSFYGFNKELVPKENFEDFTKLRALNLIGSLIIAASSMNLLASSLLEDDQGKSRAPLLLSLLSLKVVDISLKPNTKIRKFIIHLEYGIGLQVLRWSVTKTAKDLLYLHSKFKFDNWRNDVIGHKNMVLPKYPIPPLLIASEITNLYSKSKLPKNFDNFNFDSGNSNKFLSKNSIINNSLVSIQSFKEQTTQLKFHTANNSISFLFDHSPEQLKVKNLKNQEYIKDVTNYLNELIKLVGLKPQSNRLFVFFELSPISSLLNYETGYRGKQGLVHIGGSTKSQGWRVSHFKVNSLKNLIDRHSEKWFLIRNSYAIYVNNINTTIPLEVFLVDSKFKILENCDDHNFKEDEESDYDDSFITQKKFTTFNNSKEKHKNVFNHFKITIENSERKLTIIPKSLKEKRLWTRSLIEMKNSTKWSETHRFDSFAPIRTNCYAQWFVDGRDYFWAVSSALEMAKDVIFIHDWWLSPELYLRRPAVCNQQWRLDRILQRKAKEGVKIFVIIYRNVGTTVATDSLYTKHVLFSLNEDNIHVIRSPNQILQNIYFWAHHEKLCVIDHTIAFLGGIDLCYGRFDTPDHVLVDDSKLSFNSNNEVNIFENVNNFQTFPGKDYSNPRIKDFYSLDKPYENMYNRDIVPRMPWHDVLMITSGKVARDISRHFVQRWNYLIRQKRPSRFTPLLTPPSDLSNEELIQMGISGTCEVQFLRSSGNWSSGLKEHEQSIQNAYLKLIESSEHFIYIENQFFVTSCVIDGNVIHNRIGDAIVDRIIKAHNENTVWKAVIIIPLMPGFKSQVDEPDGSSVRVIMQCQYMSVSRGSSSIFAKLINYGINPNTYIQFFSLRKWGMIGPDKTLVTEQVYVHAKTMIVDDRIAIIGSANINERSMVGYRDSEVATIVQDTKKIMSKMNGKPYLVNKFAHTLRVRLMREHLGIDVDIIDTVERNFSKIETFAKTKEGLELITNSYNKKEHIYMSSMVEIATRNILNLKNGTKKWKKFKNSNNINEILSQIDLKENYEHENVLLKMPVSFNNRTGVHEANKGIKEKKKLSSDPRLKKNLNHKNDIYGIGLDQFKNRLTTKARFDSYVYLKEMAIKSSNLIINKSFVPDYKIIKLFLDNEDETLNFESNEVKENEHKKDKEKWLLLKKLSYLQMISEKQKNENKELYDFNNDICLNIKFTETEFENSNIKNELKNKKNEFVNVEENKPNRSNKKINNNLSFDIYNYDINLLSLDDDELLNIIDQLNNVCNDEYCDFIDPYCIIDPLCDNFYENIWVANATRNTNIYRMVFHTQPDDHVLNWNDYKKFSKLQRLFMLAQKHNINDKKNKKSVSSKDFPKKTTCQLKNTKIENDDKINQNFILTQSPPFFGDNKNTNTDITKNDCQDHLYLYPEKSNGFDISFNKFFSSIDSFIETNTLSPGKTNDSTDNKLSSDEKNNEQDNNSSKSFINIHGNTLKNSNMSFKRSLTLKKKKFYTDRIFTKSSALKLLNQVHGNLVLFPTCWLTRELEGGNWFYNTDRIPPIDIYD